MEDGAYRGEIFLEMTYYAKNPPLQRRASKWKPSERLARPTNAYAYPDVPSGPSAQSLHAVPNQPAVAVGVSASAAGGTSTGRQQDTLPTSHSGRAQQAQLPPTSTTHMVSSRKHDALPPLPEEPSNNPEMIPAILRPGAGPSRTSPRTSPRADDLLLQPDLPLHTHTSAPPREPLPPVQLPVESIPPYLQPGRSHSLIPEPHVPPATQPYLPPATLPPPQSYPPASQSPVATSQPYMVSSQPYGSPPRHVPPLPSYGSPPRHYAPLSPAMHIPPVAPPPASSYPLYTYAPPVPPVVAEDPSVDDLPDPYLQARYQTPLPLPNEPLREAAPPPYYRKSSVPASAPASAPAPAPPPLPARTSSPPPPPKDRHPSPHSPARMPLTAPTHSRGPSREEEERDRLLALALEQEEEERQRRQREQEERDRELARQLDLELNLERENAAVEGGAADVETGHIPGAW
ncbi:hypothetical protein BD414DRAFT_472289 [Trametes punicea]|nr:hypothetical protein BD414DRAFT_472289 [Trametes punicea]